MFARSSRQPCSRSVEVRCAGVATGLGDPTAVEVELQWDPRQPAAVTAVFTDPHSGASAPWSLARALLAESLEEPGPTIGDGDVKVTTGGFSVYLQLMATAGSVVVEIPRGRLQGFLRSVERRAPAALEDRVLGDAVDRLVDQLLLGAR